MFGQTNQNSTGSFSRKKDMSVERIPRIPFKVIPFNCITHPFCASFFLRD